MPFSGSTQRWKTPVTLRLTSSLFIIAYAPARRCTSLAEISSAGSSLLTRNLRMGWAHDGAMTSSTVSTATVTRVSGLGGGELESAAASCDILEDCYALLWLDAALEDSSDTALDKLSVYYCICSGSSLH